MFYLGIILMGVIAFMALPVEMMPNVSFGDITINIDVRGGMPASEVEKRITKACRRKLSAVSPILKMSSLSPKRATRLSSSSLNQAPTWTLLPWRSGKNSIASVTISPRDRKTGRCQI